jgi:UDP-N-acetyl-D-mannosaminuronic acid transferase (WecB/TagA/CpsF family)
MSVSFDPPISTKRVLGLDFFDGTAPEAVEYVSKHGGLVVAPGAPSMVALKYDAHYRRALAEADFAIADSGWMVLFWRLLRGEQVSRISGLAFFKALLASPDARAPGYLFWVLASEHAKTRTLEFAKSERYPVTADDCYVAPNYRERTLSAAKKTETSSELSYYVTDPDLLALIEQRKPKHIIIAIGGGMQDKLGSYLKRCLSYGPGIYCIGAAPGFITGDQVAIPAWADRFFAGWIFRLVAQPRIFVPRLWKARKLPFLILRYGRKMPPLQN